MSENQPVWLYVTEDGTYGDLRTVRALPAGQIDTESLSDGDIAAYAEHHGIALQPPQAARVRQAASPVAERVYLARHLNDVELPDPPHGLPLIAKIDGTFREIFEVFEDAGQLLRFFGIPDDGHLHVDTVVAEMMKVYFSSESEARDLLMRVDLESPVWVAVRYLVEEKSGREEGMADAWHFFRYSEPVTVLLPVEKTL